MKQLTLHGKSLVAGRDVEIDGAVWSYQSILNMSDADREGLGIVAVEPPPYVPSLDEAVLAECDRIDQACADRDARDFPFDFGNATCVDQFGPTVAGIRELQMQEVNVKDWQGQQQRAIAALLPVEQGGDPNKLILVIVKDNAVVICPPLLFIQCFEAGAERRENNAMWRSRRKTLVRSCQTIEEVETTRGETDAGWPDA